MLKEKEVSFNQVSFFMLSFISYGKTRNAQIQSDLGYLLQVKGSRLALTSLYELESTISQRKAELAGGESGKPSWTKRLLLDNNLLCSKIR